MHALDFGDESPQLGLFGGVDDVRVVDANAGRVGGDGYHADPVELFDFLRCRQGGSRHATERGVEAEEMLQADGAQDFSIRLGTETLLGFEPRPADRPGQRRLSATRPVSSSTSSILPSRTR